MNSMSADVGRQVRVLVTPIPGYLPPGTIGTVIAAGELLESHGAPKGSVIARFMGIAGIEFERFDISDGHPLDPGEFEFVDG